MSKTANRIVYGEALCRLAGQHMFYVMDADLSKATGTKRFADAYPERFFDMGIAEQNLMATAAGMSSFGTPVIASTFAMFGAGRAYEQIRNSIAYPRANVKIVCSHAGVMIGEDGASHQCLEDLALMRVLPGMTVLAPCDGWETQSLLSQILSEDGPCYMRFGRREVEQVHKNGTPIRIGRAVRLREGNDVSLIACGEMVQECLKACEMLKERGISAGLIDMHTVKPLDREAVCQAAEETGLVVCVEDHSVIGGLASAVAEVMAEYGRGRLARIGIEDRFGCSGQYGYLAEHFGLSAARIADKVEAMKGGE